MSESSLPFEVKLQLLMPREVLVHLLGREKLTALVERTHRAGYLQVEGPVDIQLHDEAFTEKGEGWELLLATPTAEIWAAPELSDLGVPGTLFLNVCIIPIGG